MCYVVIDAVCAMLLLMLWCYVVIDAVCYVVIDAVCATLLLMLCVLCCY